MSRSTMSRKLGILIVFMAVGMAVITGVAWQRIEDIEDLTAKTSELTVPQVQRINDIRFGVLRMSLEARHAMLVDTTEDRQKTVDLIVDLRKQVGQELEAFETAITSEEGAQRFKDVKAAVIDFDAAVAKIAPLLLAGASDQAFQVLLSEAVPARNRLLGAVDHQLRWQNELLQARAAETGSVARGLLFAMAGISITLLGVAIVAGVVFVRNLHRELGGEPFQAREALKRVAAGDLVTRVALQPGDSESAMAALEDMRQTLARMIGQIRAGVESVARASDEIAQGNADLSDRTERQASNLQQTASSMEQMTTSVTSNAEASSRASSLGAAASQVAERGGLVVSQVVTTMNDIAASSRQVAEISGLIDSIAFQTNILALNAAVEAARAGDQGRGFAVVAGEVRSLAGRSAEAARQIKSLIAQSVEKVDAGSKLVDDAGSTMVEIVAQVKRVTDLLDDISSATQEQRQGIGQVSQAIGQLDQTTQQNSALVEQSAAAAESLRTQAGQLAQAVAVFNLDQGRSAP